MTRDEAIIWMVNNPGKVVSRPSPKSFSTDYYRYGVSSESAFEHAISPLDTAHWTLGAYINIRANDYQIHKEKVKKYLVVYRDKNDIFHISDDYYQDERDFRRFHDPGYFFISLIMESEIEVEE